MDKPIFLQEDQIVIKRNRQKVKVNPIIGILRQSEIVDLCLKECDEYGDTSRAMPAIKAIFNIAVLALQTDLSIVGVKEIEFDGNYNISVSLTYEDIDMYVNSGMIEYVIPYVKNYHSVWELVLKAVEMHNFKQCFSQIGANLPTAEDITKSLNEFKSVIDSNPQFVEKVAKAKLTNGVLVAQKEEDGVAKETAKKE